MAPVIPGRMDAAPTGVSFHINNIIHPSRRTVRLHGYDYSTPGAYFVTICSKDRNPIFGFIEDEIMIENETSSIVRSCWNDIPSHHFGVVVDSFVVMPNHVHGIIMITDQANVSLSVVISSFKSAVTRISGLKGIWQRNYHDRVIRGDRELQSTREYIIANPGKWRDDEEFVEFQHMITS